jgi:hypothetical protein
VAVGKLQLRVAAVELRADEAFSLPVAPLFNRTGGEGSSVFDHSNALAGSGFSLDSKSGVMSGTPTEIDLLAPQPLKILVTANTDGTQSTVEFLIFVSKGAKRPPARPHGEAALATAMIGAAFRLDASDFLVVQETDEVRHFHRHYSLSL